MKTRKNSFYWLLCRHTLPWLWHILLCLLIAQVVYFGYSGIRLESELVPFADWVKAPYYSYCVALLSMAILAAMELCNTQSRYSLLRLGLETKEMFVLVFVNSFCSMLVVWAMQSLLYLASGLYYCSVAPVGTANLQILFLDSFRSSEVHAVLPSYDIGQWFTNISGIVLLASMSGRLFLSGILEKKNGFSYGCLIVAAVALRGPSGLELDVFFTVVQVVLTGILWKGGMKHETAV